MSHPAEPARDAAAPIESPGTEGTPAVSVQNLTKTYNDGAVTAVDDVSFDVETGSVVGLLGPNGAGKTTTIKAMLGSVVPDSGTIEVEGRPVQQNTGWVHERVGVMFEGSRDAYWRLTVRENLNFFTRLNGVPAAERRDRHDELLERIGLLEKADEPVRKLSRGMKQKVALASTLSQDVQLAFLDEPTLGLDVQTSLTLQEELRSLVESRNLTVVLTSHDMGVIEEVCDRVIVLSAGRIIADDSVPNLLEIFRNDAYRVRLEAPVADPTVEALDERFGVTDRDAYGSVAELEVRLADDDVHALSDELRDLGCEVVDVESVSPDLEDVFLEVTEGSGDGDGS